MFYGSLQIARAIDPHPHEADVTYFFLSNHINARLLRVKVKEDFDETLEDKLKPKQRKKNKQNKTKNKKL